MSNSEESIILYYLYYDMIIVNKEANYIPVGNYICKILDYTKQCTSMYKPCTTSYSYRIYI